LKPLPAIRRPYAGRRIALPVPSAASLSRSLPLFTVMETRRSRRAMAERPVTVAELGALLYRVARVIELRPTDGSRRQDGLRRPYPSGGSIHELEFYLAVGRCAGLSPGFYHYRGDAHALTRIAAATDAARAMLDKCANAWAQPGKPPQVLVVISSRLPRLAWKYEGIAYRVSLLNAGVAMQSLYLVATDLGLACAAAGYGNPEHFAAATKMSPWEETSIAEFGLGRGP
jgi:SagB-type dehydrogenase family enzyme